MIENLKSVYTDLVERYHWNINDFNAMVDGETHKFRYLMACLIVAGDAEDRVFAAMAVLTRRYPDAHDVSVASVSDLTQILEDHGIKYAQRKAGFMIESAKILQSKYNGRLPDTREQLEELPGVGRHIASVLLATVYGQHEFGVDYHIRRIFKRMGFLDGGTDITYEKLVSSVVPAIRLGHFSRSLVDFGQDICGANPQCNRCPFNWCPSRKEGIQSQKTVLERQTFEVMTFPSSSDINRSYSVTVRSGKLTCTCKSGKYRGSCKHIQEAQQILQG